MLGTYARGPVGPFFRPLAMPLGQAVFLQNRLSMAGINQGRTRLKSFPKGKDIRGKGSATNRSFSALSWVGSGEVVARRPKPAQKQSCQPLFSVFVFRKIPRQARWSASNFSASACLPKNLSAGKDIGWTREPKPVSYPGMSLEIRKYFDNWILSKQQDLKYPPVWIALPEYFTVLLKNSGIFKEAIQYNFFSPHTRYAARKEEEMKNKFVL